MHTYLFILCYEPTCLSLCPPPRKDRYFHGNRPLFDILQQSYCPFRSAKAERSEKATSVPIEVNFKNHSALAERKGKENNSLCNNN